MRRNLHHRRRAVLRLASGQRRFRRQGDITTVVVSDDRWADRYVELAHEAAERLEAKATRTEGVAAVLRGHHDALENGGTS